MKNRFDFFKPLEVDRVKEKKKPRVEELKDFIARIEKEDIEILKPKIPGKDDGDWRYMRPWKL